MTLKELLYRKANIHAQMAALIAPLQEQLAAVEAEIDGKLTERLASLRAISGKEFGVVNLNFEGIKVTQTVPKTVEWDQGKLLEKFRVIESTGSNPFDFMKAKFSIGEKEYGQFTQEAQAFFADARTVKPGKPTIKFEDFNQ